MSLTYSHKIKGGQSEGQAAGGEVPVFSDALSGTPSPMHSLSSRNAGSGDTAWG